MGFLYFVSFLGLSNSSSCSRSWLLQCSCSCWSNDNTFYITGMNEVLRRIRSSTNTWYTYSFHLGGTQTSNMCSSRTFSLHSKRFRASSSKASFVLVSLSPPPPPVVSHLDASRILTWRHNQSYILKTQRNRLGVESE